MNIDIDPKKYVVMRFDYKEVLVPASAATTLIKLMTEGSVYCFESKWDNDTKNSFEVLKEVELSVHALSHERFAVAKLTTAGLENKS